MLLIKFIGGLFVCASSVLFGFSFACKDICRINELSSLKSALYMLKSEIDFSFAAIPEAFLNVSERTSGAIGKFFADCGRRLKEGEHILKEIWEDGICGIKDSYLTSEDLAEFKRLGVVLGSQDKTPQLEIISIVISYIDEKTAELNKAAEKNKRLYRNLGIIGGLLAAIVMF